MRENGIVVERTRKFKATTGSDHTFNIAPNLLDRDFTADRPNHKWAGDISYIWTREGWLYLVCVLDLYSRRVVGWSMSERMTSELVISALKMALHQRKPKTDVLLHHSDRGSQYASGAFRSLLRECGITCSMSGRGNCYDNAAMESFFATLKKELIHQEDYATRAVARGSIFEYIEVFYNRERQHSTLGYRSPCQFERGAA